MEESSFDRAVHEHQRSIYTLACYLLTDACEAEDVSQEVMLRLWRLPSMLEAENLGAWLLRVTRNACIDRLRVRRSRARFLARTPLGHHALEVPSKRPGPEERTLGSQYSRQLQCELVRLSEPQRSVVILREVQGLSYRQIAEVLQIPLATVKVSLHRGRKKLRERLKGVIAHASVG